MKAEKCLVLPRAFVGAIFLVSVSYKLFTPNTAALQITGFVGGFGATHAWMWYRPFITGVVMQHVDLFAKLVTLGELYVGFGLLFGITTRLAAGVGLVMLFNFLATKGRMPWDPSVCDPADMAMCLTVLLGAAGRTLGIDHFLYKRFPRIPLW